MLDAPDETALADVNDVAAADLPRFARATRHRDPPTVDDIDAETVDALAAIPALDDLDRGSEVAITAGSRGIADMPAVVRAMVTELRERGYEPFVFPAMGSHGGATAEGQRETLASVGITEANVGCEIRSSMDVETVAEDSEGRPIFAASDALAADAVVLANRVKLHTDFSGDVESGLCKMAVIGVGKQRGAEAAHNAATASNLSEVIPERTAALVEATPIVGGVALVENAHERAAFVEGVAAADLLDREPELLDRSAELFAELPVEELDLLVLDEIGKDVSGTGMDTNVVGRMLYHGEPEPDSPAITRIYVRSLTEETHGNALGLGLADFAHADAVRAMDSTATYINAITGVEPERARVPMALPSDELALRVAYSTVAAPSPEDMRIAHIENTLEPDDLLVSEPVADELRDRPDVDVGDPFELQFTTDGELTETL